MAGNKYESDSDLQFPDLPDLDLGDPPPDIDLDGMAKAAASPQEAQPAPQAVDATKPAVDTITPPSREAATPQPEPEQPAAVPAQPEAQSAATPDVAPPPPPPDYAAREQAPSVPEAPPLQPERKTESQEVQQPGVSASQQTQQQPPQAPAAQVQKTEARQEIEDLLSDGLTEIYKTMTPQQQEVFRKKGEEAATAIEQLVTGFRASARKVVDIIRGWLSTIPGVNKFFLEQESKLKTDEIMKLQRRLKKKERLNKLNIQ